MKYNLILIFAVTIALIMTSCGDKEPEQNKEVQPEPKQEVVQIDTIQEEPVIEDEVEPVQQGPRVFIVQEGEWIYEIARKEYNDMHAWRKIYEANKDKIADPDMIYPGQELVLPE
jgi:nucleoid-associated protein YgaU